MKKLDKNFSIDIKGDSALFSNGIVIRIGDSIKRILSKLTKSDYSIDESNSYFTVYSMNDYKGISIYTRGEIVFQVSISLFPNSERFEGEITINSHKISSRLPSTDIQNIFPGMKLKTLPSIYENTFDPNWANLFPNVQGTRFKIYVDRDTKYISLICLEENNVCNKLFVK